MAYKVPDSAQEPNKAMFNEAYFVTKRLSSLQERINFAKMNPLAYNNEVMVYNYQIWFTDLTSLLNEAWPKLTEEEQADAEVFRNAIQTLLRINPPHKDIIVNGDKSVKFNKECWYLLEDGLIMFEKKVRTLLDTHGLSNPTEEDEGMF